MSDHIVTSVRLTKEEAKEREKYLFSDTYRESLKLQAKLKKAKDFIANMGDAFTIDVAGILKELE